MRSRGPLPRRAGHRSSSVVVAACLVLTGTGCAASSRPELPAGVGTVSRVVDGDTIVVIMGDATESVRLIGVDTPESVDPRRGAQCFGAEASAHTAGLLPPGTEVRLERDVEARDRYGRLLAYVYRVEDDLLVNLDLVEGGYADAVTYGDNEALYPVLVAAEAAARDAGRGLWGRCDGPDQPLGEGGSTRD